MLYLLKPAYTGIIHHRAEITADRAFVIAADFIL